MGGGWGRKKWEGKEKKGWEGQVLCYEHGKDTAIGAHRRGGGHGRSLPGLSFRMIQGSWFCTH